MQDVSITVHIPNGESPFHGFQQLQFRVILLCGQNCLFESPDLRVNNYAIAMRGLCAMRLAMTF